MIKKVELLKQDNCFTFMLKRLGVYDKYHLIESNIFIEKFPKYKIHKNLSNLEIGDVIVAYRNDADSVQYNGRVILEDGRVITKKVAWNTHFLVYEVDFISDLTYDFGANQLRIRDTKDLLEWDDEDFFIKYCDIIKNYKV